MPNSSLKTVRLRYEHIEEAIAAHLYAMTALNDDEEVLFIDLGLPIDKEGMVELEIEVVRN
jgi:hypothetical protein